MAVSQRAAGSALLEAVTPVSAEHSRRTVEKKTPDPLNSTGSAIGVSFDPRKPEELEIGRRALNDALEAFRSHHDIGHGLGERLSTSPKQPSPHMLAPI